MFTDRPAFEQRIASGGFLEHTDFLGSYYGTPIPEPAPGQDVVLEIEVQGARQVRDAMAEAVLIFIAPPDREALRKRLQERGTDLAEEIERRLRTAEEELAAQGEFEHVVVNDDVQTAAGKLERLVRDELSLH